MSTTRVRDTTAAIARLAALFPYGALEADTMPAVFLGHVADEIERTRKEKPPAAIEAAAMRICAADHGKDWKIAEDWPGPLLLEAERDHYRAMARAALAEVRL